MNQQEYIEGAVASFRKLLEEQLLRVAAMEEAATKAQDAKDCIKIGIVEGDGIGPIIVSAAEQVLQVLLDDELAAGKVCLEKSRA